jgi:chitin disaccharide deacetylase
MAMVLGSLFHLSLHSAGTKEQALGDYVNSLEPGLHMIVAHPALDGPDLVGLVPESSPRHKWARDIRVSDFAALEAPAFSSQLSRRGIEPTSIAALRRELDSHQ